MLLAVSYPATSCSAARRGTARCVHMLTRLEVDGFKNLLDLDVEFGPFTCIAGENGVGKSNVFDAIEFLSLLSSNPLMEAAHMVRSAGESGSGDPADLFWRGSDREQRRMRFAAEMIIPAEVHDDFGREARASITFVRYEVEVGYERPRGRDKSGGLVLVRESMTPIRIGQAHHHLRFPHSKKNFRDSVVSGRRAAAFISTEVRDGEAVIEIHQDGGSRGRPKPASAARAPATVLSTITGADNPTILAARREMQSWRRLALEPTSLRAADRYSDLRRLTAAGRHLPATLHRVANRQCQNADGNSDTDETYARIAARLGALSGVGARQVRVDENDTNELFTLMVTELNGIELPAQALSEGTLRFLALAVLESDPDESGLLCMEEPENGIHPANVSEMVELLRDLAVDPDLPVADDNPGRQVIVNTHSPALVQHIHPDELLVAKSSVRCERDGMPERVLRLLPSADGWRGPHSEVGIATRLDLVPYLTTAVGTQLSLDDYGLEAQTA